MYSLAWLRERVRFHLDPLACQGHILLAFSGEKDVVGHVILRLEGYQDGLVLGLVSTIYVAPASRRSGVAKRLIDRGEQWLKQHGAAILATDTDERNEPLRNLFQNRGYGVTFREPRTRMVRLSKML